MLFRDDLPMAACYQPELQEIDTILVRVCTQIVNSSGKRRKTVSQLISRLVLYLTVRQLIHQAAYTVHITSNCVCLLLLAWTHAANANRGKGRAHKKECIPPCLDAWF